MYKNILIPVVFDDEHDNAAAFQAARALSDDGARFTVLHVVEPVPSYVAAQFPKDHLAQAHAIMREKLAAMAEKLPGADPVLAHGGASRTIVDQAKTLECDCIVMASHRKHIGDLLIGSTADRTVRHAPCSVHVIR